MLGEASPLNTFTCIAMYRYTNVHVVLVDLNEFSSTMYLLKSAAFFTQYVSEKNPSTSLESI